MRAQLRILTLASAGVIAATGSQPWQGSPASRPVRVLLGSSQSNIILPALSKDTVKPIPDSAPPAQT
jgi:hypothetical protein